MPELDFYENKKISEVDPNLDSKINITGLVLEKQDDTIIIDDGTGKLKVFGNVENVDLDKLVRVFGIILPGDTGFELRADIVQDFSGVDINLYKTIDKMYNEGV